ncbi:MAG: type II toxin-antitoxin system VapC family toxin [Microcystis aeruginosa W11-03]|nr:type II toxin-antitoxin system VapC family toxin [Microcystis aeruginosa W11-03]
MNKSVLDAAAFLAYLRDEPGAEIVENALINGCYISIINRVEVLSKIVDLGESPEEIIKRLNPSLARDLIDEFALDQKQLTKIAKCLST